MLKQSLLLWNIILVAVKNQSKKLLMKLWVALQNWCSSIFIYCFLSFVQTETSLYRKIIYRQLHGVFPSAYQKCNEFCRWFVIGYTFLQIVFLLLRAYTKNIPYRFYINLGSLAIFSLKFFISNGYNDKLDKYRCTIIILCEIIHVHIDWFCDKLRFTNVYIFFATLTSFRQSFCIMNCLNRN